MRPHGGSAHSGAARPPRRPLGVPGPVGAPGPAAQPVAGDPYAQLAALAEAERDLALEGRYDELEALQGRRAVLVAALPAQPPAAAEPHLRRAAAAQAQATAALGAALGAARREAVRVERGRGAVAAYRPAAPVWPGAGRRA